MPERPLITLTFALSLLLVPAMLPARAEATQQAALTDNLKSDSGKPAPATAAAAPSAPDNASTPPAPATQVPSGQTPTAQTPTAQVPADQGPAVQAPTTQAPPTQAGGTANGEATDKADATPKSLTSKAIDKVKEVAKSASDIFSRVPCLPPKGGAQSMGSLPHVAGKLAAGKPVVIVAFGSSSTQGYGSSSPEYNYPNRLAGQLHRKYVGADITVLNQGVGGEHAPEMIKRLQAVIDAKPDLVIWQVGTNAVLRNLDPAETANLVEEGVARIQAAGADLVLVDPQYSPRVTEHPESTSRMINLLRKVAQLRHIGIFPRFEVMRQWHDQQALPVESFVYTDGLHMNDWGYACFAQTLGDDIIKSVGQIKLGNNVPAAVQTYRPM